MVVGVVFFDFRKAFDYASNPAFLQKLQNCGIRGNLWSWIKDYLPNRYMVTQVNGIKSNSRQVRLKVPQGSVLCPILSSIFCDDLRNITQDEDGELYMYGRYSHIRYRSCSRHCR